MSLFFWNFVYWADLESETICISTWIDWEESNGDSYNANVSWDWKYIVFESNGKNLVKLENNNILYNFTNIFLYNMENKEITLISKSSSWELGNSNSYKPSLSWDWKYIVYTSGSNNLVEWYDNSFYSINVFLYNTETKKTTLVSKSSSWIQWNKNSDYPSISWDWRFIIYTSAATNLVDNDTNNRKDVFLYDIDTKKNILVNKTLSWKQANENSLYPSISWDWRFITYSSYSTNWVENNTIYSTSQIYLYDIETKKTILVSKSSDWKTGKRSSYYPSISWDWRFIVYYSASTNLVENDINKKLDIFLYDTKTKKTILVSKSSNLKQGNDSSVYPSISWNWRFIVYYSKATNLIENDINNNVDIFLFDTESKKTNIISKSSNWELINNSAYNPSISWNWKYIVYHSHANNLVEWDNGYHDIFLTKNPLYEEDKLLDEKLYEENLLKKYAPILYLHEDEAYNPIEIKSTLDNSDLKTNFKTLKSSPLKESSLVWMDKDTYLDMQNVNPGSSNLTTDLPDANAFSSYKNKVYWRHTTQDWKIILQYWFFYPVNDHKDKYIKTHSVHEWDWEMIQIILDESNKNPEYATYSSHHCGYNYKWNSDDKNLKYPLIVRYNTHPIVYVGKWGHGSWGREGTSLYCVIKGKNINTFGGLSDTTSSKWKKIKPIYLNNDEYNKIASDNYELEVITWNENWIKYPGRWWDSNFTLSSFNKGPYWPMYIAYGDQPNRWNNPLDWSKNTNSTYSSLEIKSSQKLHVYDDKWNHTSINNSGIVENKISSIYYAGITNEWIKYINALGNENLKYILEWTENWTFDLNFSKYDKNTKTVNNHIFNDKEIKKSSISYVNINSDSEIEIEMDIEWDWKIDYNIKPDIINIFNVDTIDTPPPTTTLSNSWTLLTNNFYHPNRTIILTTTDNEWWAWIQKTEYSINSNEDWKTYSEPLEFTEEWEYTIYYRSIDLDNNVEETQSETFEIVTARWLIEKVRNTQWIDKKALKKLNYILKDKYRNEDRNSLIKYWNRFLKHCKYAINYLNDDLSDYLIYATKIIIDKELEKIPEEPDYKSKRKEKSYNILSIELQENLESLDNTEDREEIFEIYSKIWSNIKKMLSKIKLTN